MIDRFLRPAVLVAACLVPMPALADPTPESVQFLKEAFTACQEAISYKKVDVDLYKKWMENRAKAVRADPSIRAWTGKIYGLTVNTRFEECEALFKKALDDTEKADAEAQTKAAAAKRDPAVVDPVAEQALGGCFEVSKAVNADTASRWTYEQEMVARRRATLVKEYPDAETLKTLKPYGPTAAGVTWGAVFTACVASLDKGLAAAKASEAKRAAADKEARKLADAETAATEKKWLAKLKGDRLKLYKRRNNTMPSQGDEQSRTWVYIFYVGTGTCTATYTFNGNSLAGVKHEGGSCSQVSL